MTHTDMPEGFHLEPNGLFQGSFLLHHDGHQTVFVLAKTDGGWIARERARLRERKRILAGPTATPEQCVFALLSRQWMTRTSARRCPDLSDRAIEVRRYGPGR